ANNPHAAGLDCGACCGQTGEVNARSHAALLNDPAVRQALAGRDFDVPERTHFLAALHNTTTDEVELFDTDLVPASHVNDLAFLRKALAEAGRRARAERAPSLGLAHLADQPGPLLRAVKTRANDWAQTRPEWGLANNAAFIVAPRTRSQSINLAGRSFLHDYDWRRDTDGSILELIMTAPMVVTQWINMQYFASTVDNPRYGSGNKVLHNVVGGRIGVFEGNGGDLRIGLPMQSLHDGTQWMHTPLRLSVFIEAPQAGIEAVIAKHELVRQLLDHRWLYLFRIDSETNAVEAYSNSRWQTWVPGLD
ncbi:MAG: putative inorganic carbon transporter subunit DabA, partial [Burkholderiales bacterium]